jgi:hypothetical protein
VPDTGISPQCERDSARSHAAPQEAFIMFDAIPDFALVSFFFRLIYFLITLLAAVLFLRWFDRSLKISFRKDVWDVIRSNPLALAVYHGLRFFAVLQLGAAFLS